MTPDDLMRLVLEHFFGRASIVVFMFVLVMAIIAWVSAVRHGLSIMGLLKAFFSYSSDRLDGASQKFRSVVFLAVFWIVWYGVASFVTQIWAGSEYSPGQGNGLTELLMWSAMFGLLALSGVALLMPRSGEAVVPVAAAAAGYFAGAGYAVYWFTQKGGPQPGDWWVAPAFSCCFAFVAAGYSRLESIRERETARNDPPAR